MNNEYIKLKNEEFMRIFLRKINLNYSIFIIQ